MNLGEDLQAPEMDQPVLELQAGQEAATTRQQQASSQTPGQALPVAAGGTGAGTAAAALANLGAAPANAAYVALSTSTGLSGERVLTGTANQILITDNGAGNTVVLSFIPTAGWGTPSGTLSRATFDSTTITLPDLAARVAAMITDLLAKGTFGP